MRRRWGWMGRSSGSSVYRYRLRRAHPCSIRVVRAAQAPRPQRIHLRDADAVEHEEGIEGSPSAASSASRGVSLLFISNGHGEDRIAASIVKAIATQVAQRQQDAQDAQDDDERQHQDARADLDLRLSSVRVSALPVVGEGDSYTQLGLPLVCRTQRLPSGGFIARRPLSFVKDVRKGLLALTRDQWRGIKAWAEGLSREREDACIVAVGDVVPLAMAVLAVRAFKKKAPHASPAHLPKVVFVACAKSQYYLAQDQQQTSCVYYPWERWLMNRECCKLVAPRDQITANVLYNRLSKNNQKVQYFGNPMMDDMKQLESLEILDILKDFRNSSKSFDVITLLPGTRIPESYRNLKLMLHVCNRLLERCCEQQFIYMLPIPNCYGRGEVQNILEDSGWHFQKASGFAEDNVIVYKHEHSPSALLMGSKMYAESLNSCKCAIAMAGTATEQCVGLGKPVVTIVGDGPQFNRVFAEAQQCLLGEDSLKLSDTAEDAVDNIESILKSRKLQMKARVNGIERMGLPGASAKIAQSILKAIQKS